MRSRTLLGLSAGITVSVAALVVATTIGPTEPGRRSNAVEIHARIAEMGGFAPAHVEVNAGEPVRFRLTSDDGVHGFAIGQMDQPRLVLEPNKPVETEVTFSRPGRYAYYCTQFCGPGHWRMRGVIDVLGTAGSSVASSEPPMYVQLGLDIDVPHPAFHPPTRIPSAQRGAAFAKSIPTAALSQVAGRAASPDAVWKLVRENPDAEPMTDDEVWDAVAWLWRNATSADALKRGDALYAANCSTCHGATGNGDGVMASLLGSGLAVSIDPNLTSTQGRTTVTPTRFTDPALLLGASPALLEGKIIRGGMGTGMPYWGPMFTLTDTQAVVDYLWTLQFRYDQP